MLIGEPAQRVTAFLLMPRLPVIHCIDSVSSHLLVYLWTPVAYTARHCIFQTACSGADPDIRQAMQQCRSRIGLCCCVCCCIRCCGVSSAAVVAAPSPADDGRDSVVSARVAAQRDLAALLRRAPGVLRCSCARLRLVPARRVAPWSSSSDWVAHQAKMAPWLTIACQRGPNSNHIYA